MKNIFRKIHTERFHWYDEIIVASLFSFLLVILGQILGMLIQNRMGKLFDQTSPVYITFSSYFVTIGCWIVPLLYFLIFRHRRPILKALGTKPAGNNVRYLLLGLLIGFGLNFLCALIAIINKDIHLSFRTFDPLVFLLLLFAVFVQSSSEEVMDRGYLFQVLIKGYRNKWAAIIGNTLIFALMHFMNPGFTWLAMANIFFSGLLFSLFVCYFDSIWCPFGIHTGWNFTQSILLGLPNSGLVMPYSIFELDTASARNSFVYNVAFGIEGTVFSTIILALACLVTFLIGRKRAGKPYDIWEKKDIQSA